MKEKVVWLPAVTSQDRTAWERELQERGCAVDSE